MDNLHESIESLCIRLQSADESIDAYLRVARISPTIEYKYMEITQLQKDHFLKYTICPWQADPRIPVLYFSIQGESRAVTVDQLFSILESTGTVRYTEDTPKPLISQGEHPITGIPEFYLHPCETEQFLKDVEMEVSNHTLLLYMWLQTFGQYIGLQLPLITQ